MRWWLLSAKNRNNRMLWVLSDANSRNNPIAREFRALAGSQ
ncbi:hypothetical protein HMPREF3193_00437 [Bifidobacterium breve]|nr:hypothetical protein HMPREF3193_00437 [Bifidobacterium breve]